MAFPINDQREVQNSQGKKQADLLNFETKVFIAKRSVSHSGHTHHIPENKAAVTGLNTLWKG